MVTMMMKVWKKKVNNAALEVHRVYLAPDRACSECPAGQMRASNLWTVEGNNRRQLETTSGGNRGNGGQGGYRARILAKCDCGSEGRARTERDGVRMHGTRKTECEELRIQ